MERIGIGKIKSTLKSVKRAIKMANDGGRFARVQELKEKKRLLVVKMQQLNRAAYHGAAAKSNTETHGA
jgi:hypothetical protein